MLLILFELHILLLKKKMFNYTRDSIRFHRGFRFDFQRNI